MKFQLRKCKKCNRFTLKYQCIICKDDTESVHPAKFSPDDKYMNYRSRDRY